MRLKPIFTNYLIVGLLSLPLTAYPLGLGKISVLSGLGQPLNAEIELVSVGPDELDSLTVRVADPSTYRQNNVEYQSGLGRARISIERRRDGRAYLKIITPQPFNDPYVDLLLEMNWAQGRLVRNYTFLLDPPEGLPGSRVAESTPAVQGQALPAQTTAQPTAGKQPVVTSKGDSYGPVKRGETLGKIANQVKPEGVTVEQMLVALYRANRDAFINNNINLLRSGQTLTIPGKEDVAAIASTDAAKLVRIQAADWQAYRDRVAAAAPTAGESSAASKITAQVEDQGLKSAPTKDRLQLSKGEAGIASKGGASKDAAKIAATEDAIAKEKALQEANERIAQLEKMVKDLQARLTLSSDKGAQLQTQASAVKAETPKDTAKIEPKPPESKAPVTSPPTTTALPVTPTSPTATAPTTAAPATEPSKTAEPSPSPAPAVTATPAVEPPKAVKADSAKAKAKTPPQPAQAEASFIDDLRSNTPLLAAGGAAILLGGGVLAMLVMRRKKTNRGLGDSIMTGTDIKTNTVFGNTGGGVVNTGDNSLTTGFSRQGLGNIDTDEVDPIAEAEVYLAYGRDAQAEEILRDALQKDPSRHEIYLKLLEIQSQNNKPAAFETLASELYAATKGQGDVWAKAAALGRQLDPNNPLYASQELSAAAPNTIPQPTGDVLAETMKFEPEHTQVFTVPPALTPEAPPAAEPKAEKKSLDFNLDDLQFTSPKKSEPTLQTTTKIEPLEFDLDLPAKPKTDTAILDKPVVGLDSGLRKVDTKATDTVRTSASAAETTLPGLDLNNLDLAFDPDRSADPTPSVMDGQWHDAATKLDLAKAYQEMGDLEGAREILREVLHEGDDEQKKEAQTLLAKLA